MLILLIVGCDWPSDVKQRMGSDGAATPEKQ
jgi:hypothetical protein